MSKDVEKMNKREKELQEENIRLYEQWKQAGENITQLKDSQVKIVAKINQNAGALQEIDKWKVALKSKEPAVEEKNKK